MCAMSETLATLKRQASRKVVELYQLECTTDTAPNDTKIFASKYKIRDILLDLLDMLKQVDDGLTSPESALLWSFFNLKLATTFIETEERQKGRQKLHEILSTLQSRPTLAGCFQAIETFAACTETTRPEPDDVIASLPRSDLQTFAGLLQSCFNSLAVVSAPSSHQPDAKEEERPDTDTESTALYWLRRAEAVFQIYFRLFGGLIQGNAPECWESLGFFDSLDASSPTGRDTIELVKELMFETGYTTTLFMLAQAYSNDDERSEAAKYCQQTLQRQLQFAERTETLLTRLGVENHKEASTDGDTVAVPPSDWLVSSVVRIDPVEWATNASTLGEYYLACGQYEATLECLLSAWTVLEDPQLKHCLGAGSMQRSNEDSEAPVLTTASPRTPNFCQAKADVAKRMIDFALRLMDVGSKRLADEESEPKVCSGPSPPYGSMFQLCTDRALNEAYNGSACVADDKQESHHREAIETLSTPPKEYAAAAYLFRWIGRLLPVATAFYTMDDHCTEAVELSCCHARAYSYIAIYESDPTRQCCMQKRRTDILEGLLDRLNPQHYMALRRQIMFDLADALSIHSALKVQKTGQSVQMSMEARNRVAKKSNELAQRAIDVYKRFLQSFNKPSDNSEPEFYEDSYLRPVLLAYFYSARLHSKMLKVTPKARSAALTRALENYQTMVRIADRHIAAKPDLADKVGCEVEMAREMIQLLPAQISQIVENGRSAV
ncbi:hypothetical protein SprV_0702450200 [Sparganum proliferum]